MPRLAVYIWPARTSVSETLLSGSWRSSPYRVHGSPTRSGRMPCESVDRSEDVRKEPARQVALDELYRVFRRRRLSGLLDYTG